MELGPARWHRRDFGKGGGQVPPSPVFSYLGIFFCCCKVAVGQTNNGLSEERGLFFKGQFNPISPLSNLTRS